jgi:hypothetical protein
MLTYEVAGGGLVDCLPRPMNGAFRRVDRGESSMEQELGLGADPNAGDPIAGDATDAAALCDVC